MTQGSCPEAYLDRQWSENAIIMVWTDTLTSTDLEHDPVSYETIITR